MQKKFMKEEKRLLMHLKKIYFQWFQLALMKMKCQGDIYHQKNEESSESEDTAPDISTSEQTTLLEKFYGSDLINKYF